MGPLPYDGGFAVRVWAPHASAVAVVGDFNGWSPDAHPLTAEDGGCWYTDIEGARAGQEYQLLLRTEAGELRRVDPYARQVTNSVGNGILVDPIEFDWQGDDFACPPRHELVVYELHVGTFDGGAGTFAGAVERLDHLADLGVNAIELMPVAEFAGDDSWGYNPAHPFAVESVYGGPDGLRLLVREAHRRGIAVLVDVVHNHLGPSDLATWQFDGWSENGKGGIYFYNDDRSATPWGDTRPDYGRPEVRRYLVDHALMWLREYHVDGLRFDMTAYIRSTDGNGDDLPDGWSLLREVNEAVRDAFPDAVTIAEDLRGDARVTAGGDGGLWFHSQWDGQFVHPVRTALAAPDDGARPMALVAQALANSYGDGFDRVIYTESHDEVANGSTRVPSEVDPDDPTSWRAQKLSTLGAALALTSRGIPMLFQGQEWLQGGYFQDTVPLDWSAAERHAGTVRLYRDLIALRRDADGWTAGLRGAGLDVHHVDEQAKVIAFRRWTTGGPGDDVLVVANLAGEQRWDQVIGVPAAGTWRVRLNSDVPVYGDFAGEGSGDVEATAEGADGQPARVVVGIGAYSVLVLSRD